MISVAFFEGDDLGYLDVANQEPCQSRFNLRKRIPRITDQTVEQRLTSGYIVDV